MLIPCIEYRTLCCKALNSGEPNWQASNFPTTYGNPALELTTWGWTADKDRDGITNNMEYALGTDPNVANDLSNIVRVNLVNSGNDQFLEEAFHKVQAIATELSLQPENFNLEGGIGYTNCPAGETGTPCDRRALQTPASAIAPAGIKLNYRVTRQEPLLWRGFALRESQDLASSSSSVDVASFEISVRIDGSAKRLGSAHIVQGIAVRVPALR